MTSLRLRFRFLSVRAAAFVGGLLIVGGSPALAQTCPQPGAAENEAIARAYFDAVNKGDAAALEQLLAPDYRHEGALATPQDRALHIRRVLGVRTGFPDGVYAIDWVMVDGDKVVTRNRFSGTHTGTFDGVPASGKPVAVGAFFVHRIACGKIAETWNAGDGLGLFRQIGAIPGPPTTPANQELRPAPRPAASASCQSTTPAQNEAAARRWYDEVLNQGRFEVLNDILTDDVVHHAGIMVDLSGREATGGSLRAIRAGFPDIRFTVDDVVKSGDMVLIRWAGKGTQTGPFLGSPPSGRTANFSGMNAFRFACGKIVEGWSEANGLTILRQIGAIK